MRRGACVPRWSTRRRRCRAIGCIMGRRGGRQLLRFRKPVFDDRAIISLAPGQVREAAWLRLNAACGVLRVTRAVDVRHGRDGRRRWLRQQFLLFTRVPAPALTCAEVLRICRGRDDAGFRIVDSQPRQGALPQLTKQVHTPPCIGRIGRIGRVGRVCRRLPQPSDWLCLHLRLHGRCLRTYCLQKRRAWGWPVPQTWQFDWSHRHGVGWCWCLFGAGF